MYIGLQGAGIRGRFMLNHETKALVLPQSAEIYFRDLYTLNKGIL